MAKKLYMVFKLNDTSKDRFLTLILSRPKDDLVLEDVKPVMQAIVDKEAFVHGSFKVAAIWDAYIRDDQYMIDNGVDKA